MSLAHQTDEMVAPFDAPVLSDDEQTALVQAGIPPDEVEPPETPEEHERRTQHLLSIAKVTPVSQPQERHTKDGYVIYPVSCPECKQVVLWSSLRDHLKNKHGIKRPKGTLVQSYFETIRFHGEYTPKASGPAPYTWSRKKGATNGKPGQTAAQAADAKRKREERERRAAHAERNAKPQEQRSHKVKKLKPIDPDELINTVLTALFPKGMPVDKRVIINDWAEATELFIAEAEL